MAATLNQIFLIALQLLLAILFVFSAVGKGLDSNGFAGALAVTGFRDSIIKPLEKIVPGAEVGLALALVCGTARSRQLAIIASILLLATFSAWMITVVARGQHVSCACFGSKGALIGWITVARNVVLIGVALTALFLSGHSSTLGLPLTIPGIATAAGSALLVALLITFRYGRRGMTLSGSSLLIAHEGNFT